MPAKQIRLEDDVADILTKAAKANARSVVKEANYALRLHYAAKAARPQPPHSATHRRVRY